MKYYGVVFKKLQYTKLYIDLPHVLINNKIYHGVIIGNKKKRVFVGQRKLQYDIDDISKYVKSGNIDIPSEIVYSSYDKLSNNYECMNNRVEDYIKRLIIDSDKLIINILELKMINTLITGGDVLFKDTSMRATDMYRIVVSLKNKYKNLIDEYSYRSLLISSVNNIDDFDLFEDNSSVIIGGSGIRNVLAGEEYNIIKSILNLDI
jgi:hypothetical protein